MTPLQLQISLGEQDDLLLEHINRLESFDRLSPGEENTLFLLWTRLEIVTTPKGRQPSE